MPANQELVDHFLNGIQHVMTHDGVVAKLTSILDCTGAGVTKRELCAFDEPPTLILRMETEEPITRAKSVLIDSVGLVDGEFIGTGGFGSCDTYARVPIESRSPVWAEDNARSLADLALYGERKSSIE